MNYHLKCPSCRETMVVVVTVDAVNKDWAYGAKSNKAHAENLRLDVADAVAFNEGKFSATGKLGLWENRRDLPEWLRVVGKHTLNKATRDAIDAREIEQRLVDGNRLLFRGVNYRFRPATKHSLGIPE